MAPKRRRAVPAAKVVDRTVPGRTGKQIPVRIYTPRGEGPFPVLMFFHGGGWVFADLDTEDSTCGALCTDVPCIVVAVAYRLAPEHKFPSASDDCLDATNWLFGNAAELNADPGRVAVAGDSAGGNLAAVTALRLRDSGDMRLRGQLLIYPVTDYHTPPTQSFQTYGHGFGMTSDEGKWFWSHYLSSDGDAMNPYAAPMRANTLRGLPSTLVITAECDILRDEAEAYAKRLASEGTAARVSRYDGMIHGFVHFRRVFPEGRRALREAIEWLRQVLHSP